MRTIATQISSYLGEALCVMDFKCVYVYVRDHSMSYQYCAHTHRTHICMCTIQYVGYFVVFLLLQKTTAKTVEQYFLFDLFNLFLDSKKKPRLFPK